MIGGILLRVLVGVAAGALATAAVAGTAYVVYKIINKDNIKKDVKEQIQDKTTEETLSKLFDIKVKEKISKGETHKVDDIERWAEEDTVVVDVRDKNKNTIIPNVIVTGDEFGDDVRVGSVIKLYD